jgi:hypothetical protein
MIPTGKEIQNMSDEEVMGWAKHVLRSSTSLYDDIEKLSDRMIPCRECLRKWRTNEKCEHQE